MTVHITVTWPSVLMVIGAVAVLWFLIRMLYLLWAIFWWGK